MKTRCFPIPGFILLVISLLSPLIAKAGELDFGDGSSSVLTIKAWESLTASNYAATVAYTTKCIDTYQDAAVDQEKSLGHPGAAEKGSWALNDVGTCYFIRGKAKEGLKKIPDAIKDYKYLIEHYAKAECSDDKGSKWSPAKLAKDQMTLLMGNIKEVDTIWKLDLDSITIKAGAAMTAYRITSQTQVVYKGQPANFTDLKEGMAVVVTPAANPQDAASISADDPPKQ